MYFTEGKYVMTRYSHKREKISKLDKTTNRAINLQWKKVWNSDGLLQATNQDTSWNLTMHHCFPHEVPLAVVRSQSHCRKDRSLISALELVRRRHWLESFERSPRLLHLSVAALHLSHFSTSFRQGLYNESKSLLPKKTLSTLVWSSNQLPSTFQNRVRFLIVNQNPGPC